MDIDAFLREWEKSPERRAFCAYVQKHRRVFQLAVLGGVTYGVGLEGLVKMNRPNIQKVTPEAMATAIKDGGQVFTKSVDALREALQDATATFHLHHTRFLERSA